VSSATLGLQSLAEMAHLLAQTRQLDRLVEMAAEHARLALGAASVSISRFLPETDSIRTIINVGDLAPDEERWPENETYSLAGYDRLFSTLHDRQSWVDSLDDPDTAERERQLLRRLGKGSCLVTCIVVDGRSWGEFFATQHVGAPVFDHDAIAYAEVLAAILASAVSRALREAALEDLALRDPLTGLLNRRALDDCAAKVFDLGDEQSRPVAVLAMDIDGLKQVNDSEGHPRGDQVIREAAAALTSAFGPLRSSVVARVGGDEFTVMVSGGDVDLAEKTINAVCAEVAAGDFNIGLSAGLATVELTPGSTLTATELFASADRAQYVAKRTGSCVAVLADDVSA
jgi:diguanylate cyclase (GGDEF)-like protein